MNRSFSLRLMDLIFAVLLAVTLAIFSISMPRAAAPTGHDHAAMQVVDHGHSARPSGGCDHEAATADGSDHSRESHDADSANCCSLGACHALQTGTVLTLHSPFLTAVPLAKSGDEQVEGVVSGRLDRPPRMA